MGNLARILEGMCKEKNISSRFNIFDLNIFQGYLFSSELTESTLENYTLEIES